MIVKIPRRINRVFVRDHPNWIFVYSNDLIERGLEGMVWHFKGFSNAFMVPTAQKICANSIYFRDTGFTENAIREAVAKIPSDKGPIIPVPKIGLGCSRMKELAPLSYELLWNLLNQIKYPNIEVDYSSE